MKPLKHIALFLSFFVYASSNAQSDTSNFKFKSLLAYNLNPGISFGIGGGRPRGYLPQPTIKLGRVELGYSPGYDNESYTMSGFQMDVDIVRFKGWNNADATATLGMGFSIQESRPFQIMTEINRFSFLAGVNQKMSKRSYFSIKIGVLNRHSLSYLGEYSYQYQNLSTVINETDKIHPYGEICYKWYVLPFAKKQKVLRKLVKGDITIDKQKVKKGFAKWFNPFWSTGLGLDRAYGVVPSGGVKVGPVKISVSMLFVGESVSHGAKCIVNTAKLKSEDKKYHRYFTVGISSIGTGSIDYSQSLIGLNAGMAFEKKSKRISTEFNVGFGRISTISSYTVYDENMMPSNRSTFSYGWTPTGSISLNVYLFKFTP